MATDATSEPKLRWFQFSLRTLLVFVTVCAIPCSWLAVRMREAERKQAERAKRLAAEDKLAKPIKDLGGMVWFKPQCVPNGDRVDLFDSEVTDAALEHIRWWPDIKVLRLDQTQVTDAGLEHLKGLSQLQRLSLDGTQVTDAGLEHLKGLSQLQKLCLKSPSKGWLQSRIGGLPVEADTDFSLVPRLHFPADRL